MNAGAAHIQRSAFAQPRSSQQIAQLRSVRRLISTTDLAGIWRLALFGGAASVALLGLPDVPAGEGGLADRGRSARVALRRSTDRACGFERLLAACAGADTPIGSGAVAASAAQWTMSRRRIWFGRRPLGDAVKEMEKVENVKTRPRRRLARTILIVPALGIALIAPAAPAAASGAHVGRVSSVSASAKALPSAPFRRSPQRWREYGRKVGIRTG